MIYVPTKARAQASGFGFQKLQAGPKAASSQAQGPAWPGFFWPGLARLLALGPEPAPHYAFHSSMRIRRCLATKIRKILAFVLTPALNNAEQPECDNNVTCILIIHRNADM